MVKEKNKFINLNKRIIFLLSIILVVPIIIFTTINYQNPFSKNVLDWAAFSTFYIIFIALGNLIVFLVLSFVIHNHNVTKDNENTTLKKQLNKPIIIFRMEEYASCYYIQNIGNGSALNVVLYVKSKESECWDASYKYFSFGKDYSYPINLHNIHCLCAVYNDIFDNKYATFMRHHDLKVFDFDNEEFLNSPEFEEIHRNVKDVHNRIPFTDPPSI